jgi:hypothetical protein
VLSTLLLITTLVALVAVTVSTLLAPAEIAVGLAVIATVSPVVVETVTVAEAVTLSPVPVAVIV